MQMLLDESGSVADISSTAIEDIIKLCEKGESGKNIALPYGIIAEIEYGNLVITARRENISEFEYILKPDVDVFIAELNKYARLENCDAKENDGAIYFSADSVDNIVLRNRREGDVFTPSGMNGRKKLKNLFIDEKISRAKRNTIPIITVDGKIATVGDLRCDSEFAFDKRQISLKIRLISQEEKSIGTKTI